MRSSCRDFICFNCKGKGHYSNDYPQKVVEKFSASKDLFVAETSTVSAGVSYDAMVGGPLRGPIDCSGKGASVA